MNLHEVVRYPEGITPHGEYHLLSGEYPSMHFHAHDGSIDFRLLGGLASPFADPTQPAVSVQSLKGLIPPWQYVDQKGATQHGVSTVANLFDPIEVTAELKLIGNDRKALRQLVRDWIASNEHMKTGELSWFTPELGRWWADMRWFKTPPNAIMAAALSRSQSFTQSWRTDSSFWRSYDDIDSFGFVYDSDVDNFSYVATDLGDGWDVNYTGTGGGFIYADGDLARWQDDPLDPILTDGRTVDCRRVGFETTSNNQVVQCTLGSFPEWSYPDNAYNFLWGRMKTTGTPGTWGIRLIFGIGYVRLSNFVNGVEYVIRDRGLVIPPLPGDVWTLACGFPGNPNLYKVYRNNIEVLSAIEPSGANIGPEYRGAGFGMHAGAAILTQATPASVRRWNVADNNLGAQSGFIKLTNIGDQPMWPRYTCFGPGTFTFANGPGSTEYVQFGPLLNNQVMQLRTDGELRPIVNMTSLPPTPQELSAFQRAINDFINFATAGNVPPLLQQIKSMYGILPPQGHPNQLLSGAFTNPIPAKSPGKPAKEHHIAVSISGGTSDSMILATGTPLRRYPL